MLKRTTEQITDVSHGNTAALVVIDKFFLKLGTLTTSEDAHNNTDDGKHTVAKIAVNKDRRDAFTSTRWIATLPTTRKNVSNKLNGFGYNRRNVGANDTNA